MVPNYLISPPSSLFVRSTFGSFNYVVRTVFSYEKMKRIMACGELGLFSIIEYCKIFTVIRLHTLIQQHSNKYLHKIYVP